VFLRQSAEAQDIEHTEHRVPLGDAVEAPKKVDKKDEKKDREEAPPLNVRCMFSPGVSLAHQRFTLTANT
jgi:hypothetical protein